MRNVELLGQKLPPRGQKVTFERSERVIGGSRVYQRAFGRRRRPTLPLGHRPLTMRALTALVLAVPRPGTCGARGRVPWRRVFSARSSPAWASCSDRDAKCLSIARAHLLVRGGESPSDHFEGRRLRSDENGLESENSGPEGRSEGSPGVLQGSIPEETGSLGADRDFWPKSELRNGPPGGGK